MLTPKRSKLLSYITQYIQQYGYAPNLNEMREAMNIKSASGVHVMLCSLEKDGYIMRASHRARSVKLLDTTEQIKNESVKNADTIIDNSPVEHVASLRHRGSLRPQYDHHRGHPIQERGYKGAQAKPSLYKSQNIPIPTTDVPLDSNSVDTVPLMGKIAAGTPIDVISEVIEYLSIPRAMIINRHQHYALKVDGDSMIDAGILPEDIVIICQQEHASDGDIVVALVDQSEATLKYLFQSSQGVILVAANPQYKPVYVEQERISIQGKVSGVLRVY